MARPAHNPYLPKLKKYLTQVLYPEDFENGPRCKQCEKLESDGVSLQVCHPHNDGARDRRDGTGNAYYKRLYERVIKEVGAGRPPSIELLCTGCHGNPKRTDKRVSEKGKFCDESGAVIRAIPSIGNYSGAIMNST